MRNNQHRGNIDSIIEANPVVHLGQHTKGCIIHMNHVSGGNRGNKEGTFAKIIKDDTDGPTLKQGNHGTWWNTALNTGKGGYDEWGDQPLV